MCCLDHTQVLLGPETWETSGMDGERETRAKEKKAELDESEEGRVMQEHLSLISWKEKVSSSEKAHRTKKNYNLHTHTVLTQTHKQVGLFSPGALHYDSVENHRVSVCLYLCKTEGGMSGRLQRIWKKGKSDQRMRRREKVTHKKSWACDTEKAPTSDQASLLRSKGTPWSTGL